MRISIFSVADHHPTDLPRTIAQLYGELLDQAVAADALGFHAFWVAEHHFHPYGAIPRPALFLTAAAQRTRRIRLGSAVSVLPFDNPLRIAEDFAMLDLLSGGRVDLGVGSGYLQHELAGFAVPVEEKRERFDEALLILRALWQGERVTHHGKHFQIRDVQLNVQPLQTPHPPIWIAGLRQESVPHIAAQGLPALMIPYAAFDGWDQLAAAASSYHSAFQAPLGHAAVPTLGFGLHAHCAQTREEALAEAAEPMARYVRTRLYAKQRPLTELLTEDLAAIGDEAQLQRIAARYAAAGLTDMLLLVGFGGMAHAAVLRSLERMARSLLR